MSGADQGQSNSGPNKRPHGEDHYGSGSSQKRRARGLCRSYGEKKPAEEIAIYDIPCNFMKAHPNCLTPRWSDRFAIDKDTKAIGGKGKVLGHSGNGQTSHAFNQFDPRRDSRNARNKDEPDTLVMGAQHASHDQRGQSTEAQPDKATGGKAKVSGRSGNRQTSHAHSQFNPGQDSRNDRNFDKPDILVAQHGTLKGGRRSVKTDLKDTLAIKGTPVARRDKTMKWESML